MGYRLLILSLLALTLAYLLLARQIPLDPWSAAELVNSRTLPTVYGALMVPVLLALLFAAPPGVRSPQHGSQALALTGLLMAFVAVLPLIGIWPALGALLATTLLLMGERRPLWLLALTAGIPLGGWLVVEQWLGVFVPGAALGG